MGGYGGGHVAPGGKTEHAHAPRIDPVLARVRPHPAHGPLAVPHFDGVAVTGAAQAVLHHEGGNAQGVEPFGRLQSFVIRGQADVSASGKDDHGRPVRVGRGIGRNGGLIGGGRSLGAGRAARPQKDFGLGDSPRPERTHRPKAAQAWMRMVPGPVLKLNMIPPPAKISNARENRAVKPPDSSINDAFRGFLRFSIPENPPLFPGLIRLP